MSDRDRTAGSYASGDERPAGIDRQRTISHVRMTDAYPVVVAMT